MMDSLFEILDLNNDGEISRLELHEAAKSMGWHWYEAPIFAFLDLLTITKPIPKDKFTACMQQIDEDPMGPYGRVLLHSPHFSSAVSSGIDQSFSPVCTKVGTNSKARLGDSQDDNFGRDLVPILGRSSGADVAKDYQSLLNTFRTGRISTRDAALLIIDPQRSFTKGVWMQSIGDGAAVDVEPILAAFNNCSRLLNKIYGHMEIMFTRCPFPPGSYDWDDRLAGIVGNTQLYFIKPGNSVLFPPLNGFKEWMERCIDSRKRILVIGGCTLNSCIRVSAIEIMNCFKGKNLQVVVDLSICGARTRNFISSSLFGGLSAIESAVHQMTAAGVQVVRRVEWEAD